MAFVERQKQLLKTEEFSDYILDVGERQFRVHRNIVCPQSPVLHRLCTSHFKEAKEGRGVLHEVNADILEKVLEFLYTEDYSIGTSVSGPVPNSHIHEAASKESQDIAGSNRSEISHQQAEELMVHVEIYLLAKYLDIGNLKRRAVENLTGLVKKNFRADAFVKPFARIFKHGDDGASGMRSQIMKLCLDNSEHILQHGKMSRLLLEHEPIAWTLLLSQKEKHARELGTSVEGEAASQEHGRDSRKTDIHHV